MTFTASNGVQVVPLNKGVTFALPGAPTPSSWGINQEKVEALREFFQHEKDEKLGRWRWPENPDYVVYPQGHDSTGFRYAMAVYEPTGNAGKWQEGQRSIPEPTKPEQLGILAVQAYFKAHPAKKPWHDARPTEVWNVQQGQDERFFPYRVESTGSGKRFFVYVEHADDRFPITDPDIGGADRIYPPPVG